MTSLIDSVLEQSQINIELVNNDLSVTPMKIQTNQRNGPQIQNSYNEQKKILKRDKKGLQTSQIEDLNLKRDKLIRFMENINEFCSYPLRNDIIQHCEKVNINIPSNISKQAIIKLVRNRVQKMIKNKRIKKNWSQQDLKILVWVISKYCQYHGIKQIRDGMTQADWNNIADLIPGVSGKSCMFKWLSLKKNNLADNSWVQDESLLLDQIVKKYGQNSWCKVSQELFLRNTNQNKIYRCPKQCRQHWNCYLNPSLKKGPWDKKQDYLLLRAVMQLKGTKKWAQIVKMFNGRTQNALKNRFNLIVQKQIKQCKKAKKPTQIEAIQNYLKKYQNFYHIDQKILKILEQKRNHMTQSLAKRQPKKSRGKKNKDQKQPKNQDQYMPSEHQLNIPKQTRTRRSRCRLQSYSSQESQQQNLIHPQKKEQFHYHNDSVVGSMLSIRKNQEIYQQQSKIKNQDNQPNPISLLQMQYVTINNERIMIVPLTKQVLLKYMPTNYIPGQYKNNKFIPFL